MGFIGRLAAQLFRRDMGDTPFSDRQEDQTLARIYWLGPIRVTRAYKLIVARTFLAIWLIKREYHLRYI